MDSKNPHENSAQRSEKSIGSPASQADRSVPVKPKSADIGHSKTEVPVVPPSVQDAPRLSRDEAVPIGNKKYELSLRLKGNLGHFMKRSNTTHPEVDVTINAANYRTAALAVINHVLLEAERNKRGLTDEAGTARIARLAAILADGICMMTYLKLRSINLCRLPDSEDYLLKPKVPAHFEVPAPFAYAISQLGVVEVNSLTKRVICYPVAPSAEAKRFLLPERTRWSQSVYAEAVMYAKALGMPFNTVNLDVKVGSAWWLFEQVTEDTLFQLRCRLPEDNYTEAAAVVHTLFCNDGAHGVANEIFTLSNLAAANYGSFIRGPRDDISISSFYALCGTSFEEAWRSAD